MLQIRYPSPIGLRLHPVHRPQCEGGRRHNSNRERDQLRCSDPVGTDNANEMPIAGIVSVLIEAEITLYMAALAIRPEIAHNTATC